MTAKGAWLPITDTVTGETRNYRDELFDPDPAAASEFLWSEGNNACDCNRALFFARAGGGAAPSQECGETRYHVASALCSDGQTIEIDGPRHD